MIYIIKFGRIAQLVEQRTENPRVRGSIPRPTTSNPFSNVGVFCIGEHHCGFIFKKALCDTICHTYVT